MVELVDLSGVVEEGQPVYPGNTRTQFFVTNTHEESGHAWAQELDDDTGAVERKLRAKRAGDDEEHALVRTLVVSEHGPTHVDAFSHLDPTDDASIDEIPLDRFYTPAVALDLTHVADEEFIGVGDLEAALDEAGLELREGDAVLLDTGHYAETYDADDHELRYAYLHSYTGLTADAAEWLAEAGVSNIGIDAPSIDHASAMRTKEYPAHDVCADHRMLNMENMANIDRVAGERFTLCAFPLKLKGGTGSPIRPVAILE